MKIEQLSEQALLLVEPVQQYFQEKVESLKGRHQPSVTQSTFLVEQDLTTKRLESNLARIMICWNSVL